MPQTKAEQPKPQSGAAPVQAVEDENAKPPAEIPSVKLEFAPQGSIPGLAASHVISTVLCASDGTPFVSIPQPPKYLPGVVYSLDPKGAQRFDAASAPGLYDTMMSGFFPGDDMLGLLISATTDPKQTEFSFHTKSGQLQTQKGFLSKHHHYIVEFDRNGTFKTTVQLPDGYDFMRFAELPDGNLVATAYDPVNRVPRLLLLDSSGSILHPIEIPSDFQNISELNKGQSGDALDRARAETSFSTWLFAPARQHVLVYVSRRKPILLEIGAGGSVREVPIESPPGYVIQDVIPSNDRWIIRYRRKELPEMVSVDARPETRNFVLYELNASDGSLRREFQIVSDPGFGTFCEHDGTFVGFSLSADETKFLRTTADIPH